MASRRALSSTVDAGSLSSIRLIWWFCVSRVTECHNPSFTLCPGDRVWTAFPRRPWAIHKHWFWLFCSVSTKWYCVWCSSFLSLGKIYFYLKCYAWHAKYNWEREKDIFLGQTVLCIFFCSAFKRCLFHPPKGIRGTKLTNTFFITFVFNSCCFCF